VPSKDDYVFDLITYILCAQSTSRLEKSLVFEKRLVRSIGCDSSYPGTRLDNLFVIEAEPIGGKGYKEVMAAIWEVIGSIKTTGPTEKELAAAKNNMLKDFIFNLSKNEDIAHTIAYFELIAGDWSYIVDHVSRIDKLTGADIADVLGRYLNEKNMSVVKLEK